MPLSAPVAFPLHEIVDGKCGCGADACDRIGKHPAVLWRDLELGSAVPTPAPGQGYGVKTGAAPRGSGVFVVDLDGDEAIAAFAAMGDCPETFTVETPRGWHLYFPVPDFPVRSSAGILAKGVDIRGEGGFVVGPGSPHRSGKTYVLTNDVDPAPAPDWLIDWLRSRVAPAEIQPTASDVTDPVERAYRRELFVKACQTLPPSVEGASGDTALFNVVQRGAYDLALPVADVLEIVREHFDPRCVPSWGTSLDERVTHKARDAKERSTRPRAEPIPQDLQALFETTAFEKVPAPIPVDGGLPIIWGKWNEPSLPPKYLLHGLIPEGKVVTFFAEGGSVKSWSAFALAIAVATGAPWLGMFPVVQGRTLILDFEDGREEFKRRREILMPGADDVTELGYLYGHVSLTDESTWHALATLSLKFLVIDALSSGIPADVDENSTVFAEAVKMAGRFTTATGCTVLFVHHANKTGGMRGSSAVRDQSDVVFRFDPVDETDDRKRMRMICDKPGPQKKPAPVNIELSDKGLRTFDDEAHVSGRNATSAPDVEFAIRSALFAGPKKNMREILDLIPGKSQRTVEILKGMIESGEVVKASDGYALDSDERRRERVLECLRNGEDFKTASELGKAAFVSTAFVDAMTRQRRICQSADKRFLEIL